MLRPIGDSILFVFKDGANGKGFENITDSGIMYKSFDTDLNAPRWGKVLAVGDKVKEVKLGDMILIDALRWTEGFTFDGIKIWKTVEKEVIGIGEE